MSKTGAMEYKKLKPMKTDFIWIEESDSGYEGYFLTSLKSLMLRKLHD